MLDQKLFGKFELIEVKPNQRGGMGYCRIDDKKTMFSIPSRYVSELKWGDEQRLNLYRFGETFALVPDKVGLVTARRYKGSMRIMNRNFCSEVCMRTKFKVFDAWVEEDALFFKPQKGDE